MLVASGVANISGKSVTTLIVSIVVLDREKAVPPRFDHHPGRHTLEPEQPLPVIGASPRQHQGTSEHLTILIHHVHARLGNEQRAGILHQGKYGHFPVLPVRLAQPPDYAGRWPNTPACLSSERTVSVGVAPLASHASACSAFTWMTAGLVRGL